MRRGRDTRADRTKGGGGHTTFGVEDFTEPPGHNLFEASAARALELGCTEVQGGRSPYRVKLDHGFVPVPWLAAVRGSNPSQHQAAVAWLEGLEDRHHATYDSEFHGKLARYEPNYLVPEGVGDG